MRKIINGGRQHTQAVAALTSIQIVLNMISLKEGDQLFGYCGKIQKAVNECRKDTLKYKHPSKNSERALKRMCDVYAEYVGNKELAQEIVKSEMILELWVAFIVSAAMFCLDIFTMAPIYGKIYRWRKLYALVNGLQFALIKDEPEVEQWGLMIYERAAYALENIDFKCDSREKLLSDV